MARGARQITTVYFDSSVYVAMLLDEPGKAGPAEIALTGAIQGNVRGYISALVVAEVVGCPAMRAPQGQRPRVGRHQMHEARAFLDGLDFTYIEGGQMVGRRAAELCQAHELKGPDALHLALAERAKCQQFQTFDVDQLKIQSLGDMQIVTPNGYANTTLDLGERKRPVTVPRQALSGSGGEG